MENLITTLTNIPILLPIYQSYVFRDYVTTFCITFVFIASTISHLIENHKHGMPGAIPTISPRTSYIRNRLDVLGCAIVSIRFLILYIKYTPRLPYSEILFSALSLAVAALSEHDKYNPNTKWYPYLAFHPLWHLLAAHNMSLYLDKIYYHPRYTRT